MKLAPDSPLAISPPDRLHGDADWLVGCCSPPGWSTGLLSRKEFARRRRELSDSDKLAEEARRWADEPLCRTLRSETEVYRFTWQSSFDGDADSRAFSHSAVGAGAPLLGGGCWPPAVGVGRPRRAARRRGWGR
jgi:hypothetical protein